MLKIISAKDIVSLTNRATGRTTELVEKCIDFLLSHSYYGENIGVVIPTYQFEKHLISLFQDKISSNINADIIRFQLQNHQIINLMNNNKIIFISLNSSPDKTRGIKFKDFYFDTPEYILFRCKYFPKFWANVIKPSLVK